MIQTTSVESSDLLLPPGVWPSILELDADTLRRSDLPLALDGVTLVRDRTVRDRENEITQVEYVGFGWRLTVWND